LKVEGGATFMADTVLASAVAGSQFLFAVDVTSAKKIQTTSTPAVTASNGLDAGAITVTILALPAEV